MLDIYLVISLILAAIVTCSLFWQKDIFTKLLLLNTATSLASLFICFLGTYKVNNSYIDIALIYFLLSVIANAAYLKYFLPNKTDQKTQKNGKKQSS